MTKEKSTVPRLRFPGFTTTWKQRKLGEVGYAKSGVGFPEKEQGGTTGIPFFKVSDMNTNGNENELVVANNYVTDEQISKRKWRVITEVPAIFFAKVGAAVMLNRKRLIRHPFLLDNNTMTYVFNHTQWDTNFGKTLFETIDLIQLTQVGALPSYNSSDVENINISLPTLPEQEAIGSFFSDLDQLITLHQRKLDDVKELKKALLQKMFPKGNGNDFPELRFPEFTDAWKQRKLGEEISFYNGRAYKQSELLDVGKYKVVRVGNFNTNEKWYYSNLELEDSKTIDTGDLIYLWATSFGPEIWKGAKSIYHYHIWKLIIKQVEKIDKNYLYTWLYQDKEKIAQNTNGSTMVHITKKMIENRDFEFPTLPEQEAIGSFFSDLDQLITLHQRQLDHLKLLKKALLQQMFI
ncbi:restriction endonuclease subunit S [Streptococcus suis]|uniref:restriction endonuclease subunit S n=1 Tax=Streptococcus suis TaxID=1307 RepID=UPI000CF5AC03|nr:restriction endonuclease subunit S [Streptococcus suis]HEL1620531.1 restriction endonuclease subunit S [Streptococcus suis]HEM5036931.1 restriction endonuclease subunit S [Streptococcus suis]